jgi:hypothetical protein
VPVQERASLKVITTRYTFLVNHPILRHRAIDCSDKELLVHFKDLDQLAEEGNAKVLDTHGMILSRAGELVPHSAVTSTPGRNPYGLSWLIAIWTNMLFNRP